MAPASPEKSCFQANRAAANNKISSAKRMLNLDAAHTVIKSSVSAVMFAKSLDDDDMPPLVPVRKSDDDSEDFETFSPLTAADSANADGDDDADTRPENQSSTMEENHYSAAGVSGQSMENTTTPATADTNFSPALTALVSCPPLRSNSDDEDEPRLLLLEEDHPCDLGAEVVIETEEQDKELQQQQQHLHPFQHQQQQQPLCRRISYEEIVHEESCDLMPSASSSSHCDAEQNANSSSSSRSLAKCLTVLTQWALTLQEVYEDRQGSAVNLRSTRCLCGKADVLMAEFKKLETEYYTVIEAHDRAADTSDFLGIQNGLVRDLVNSVNGMQDRLRSSVSIRVSSPKSDAVAKAAYLVGEVCDVRQYVRDAVESLVQLVYELLDVGGCKEHLDTEKPPSPPPEQSSSQDEEMRDEDVVNRVASMKTTDEDDEEEDMDEEDESEEEEEDKENSRKRKKETTNNKSKTGPPLSPTSTPSKRPRRGRTLSEPVAPAPKEVVLDLLENRRKGPRRHGLLQFVLWREALRAEKCRTTAEVDSAVKSAVGRRLSLN